MINYGDSDDGDDDDLGHDDDDCDDDSFLKEVIIYGRCTAMPLHGLIEPAVHLVSLTRCSCC